jgi:UDP-3-O-acyl N-acetylglucosamine deacetylase
MQRSIKEKIEYKGVCLHSGEIAHLEILPAPLNTGIVFKIDGVKISASVSNVVKSEREIILRKEGFQVRVVEHLLAAISGLGISNLYIQLDKEEVPFGDGSSKVFVDLFEEAGLVDQGEDLEKIKIKEPIWVEDRKGVIIGLPYEGFKISYLIKYPHRLINLQYASYEIDREVFVREIASARTYTFLSEVEGLRKKGLIKGGNLDNAVVIGEDRILNKKLRFKNEMVRHKILDLIGDLSLIGKPLKGHIIAIKSGHTLNIKLGEKIYLKYIEEKEEKFVRD